MVVQRSLHLLHRLRQPPLFVPLPFVVAIVACASTILTISAATSDENSMSINSTSIRALLALRKSISTDPTDFLASWDIAVEPIYCQWSGVRCSDYDASVVAVSLDAHQLRGTLPPELGLLSNLSYLNVSENNFYGSVPAELGKLRELTHLDLSANGFTGSIPSSISNCTLIQYLDLRLNSMSGRFPSFITNFANLVHLDMSHNSFRGERIPSDIGLLSNLEFLALTNTDVEGALPSSISNCSELYWLDVSENSLSGPVPEAVGFLKNLRALLMQHNHFEGPIPNNWMSPFISWIDISHNLLNGIIPPAFGGLVYLNILFLQNNNLSGRIPDALRSGSIDLSHNHLTGRIPEKLSSTESLDLSFNNLSGNIPASKGDLHTISTINLAGNHLSGRIPHTIAGYRGLLSLDLSMNDLDGEIPSELGDIPALRYIDLSYNGLSGSLPASLEKLKSLVYLNVSFNWLRGPIPAGGIFAIASPSAFLGNAGLCGYPINRSCEDDKSKKSSKSSTRDRLFISTGFSLLGIIVLVLCACSWRYRRYMHLFTVNSTTAEIDPIPDSELRSWTAKELRDATNGFNTANIIGAGGVSVCFKGVLNLKGSDMSVAIKRLNCKTIDGSEIRKSFLHEIKVLGEVRHRNLVKTLGFCSDRGEMALVMELMEMGDLRQTLDRRPESLNWDRRLQIAMDVAEGLLYLHYECLHAIVHCDLKPQNILLGSDMVAKVSDFGIAKLLKGWESSSAVSISNFAGTFGYVAPECASGPSISRKADVYSFGILLMELATGMNPRNSQLDDEGLTLRVWCRNLLAFRSLFLLGSPMQEAMKMDPSLRPQFESVLKLGLKCTHENARERPDMKFVREILNRITKPELGALYLAKELTSLIE